MTSSGRVASDRVVSLSLLLLSAWSQSLWLHTTFAFHTLVSDQYVFLLRLPVVPTSNGIS